VAELLVQPVRQVVQPVVVVRQVEAAVATCEVAPVVQQVVRPVVRQVVRQVVQQVERQVVQPVVVEQLAEAQVCLTL
jgi:hypothetical protein